MRKHFLKFAKKKKILIPNIYKKGVLKGMLRITLGPKNKINKFINVLKTVYEE